MRGLSLIVKLNTLFLLGVFIISIAAYLIYNRIDYREEYLTSLRFNKAAEMVRESYREKKPIPIKDLRLMDLKVINNPKEFKETEQRKVIAIPIPKYYLGVFETRKGKEYAIKTENQNIYIKDIRVEDKTRQILIAGYIFALIMLLLFYISIYRSIAPIRELERKVKKFGLGDFSVDTSSTREDEIGNLANSFDTSIKKIKSLMDGRMLFLRNAAHELKTPLTKGMIALELPDGEKRNSTLKGVFERLNTLIGELLNIEKITSGNIYPVKKEYYLKDIIRNVEKLLFVEEGAIPHNIQNEKIFVDLNLFSLAIKNLVDNAYKYANDHKVFIKVHKTEISVTSFGKPLQQDLKYYLEPFSKDYNNQSGFGLGLFIVNHILISHNITLEYSHSNGYNHFYFDTKDAKS